MMMRIFPLKLKTVFVSLSLVMAAFGGCSQTPKSDFIDVPEEDFFIKDLSNYEVLLKESREESDRLRSELAAMRIASAKQNANLQFYQGTRGNPREKEAARDSEIQEIKAHVSKLQGERDQLRRQNIELQNRSAALPEMRQLVMDIKALQTSVHQMVMGMRTLSADIVKIKYDMVQNKKRLRAQRNQRTARHAAPPARSSRKLAKITVEQGDTLYSIARAHGISIAKLKQINRLKTDTISVDQQLIVPMPPTSPSHPQAQPALAKHKTKRKPKVLKNSEGANTAQEGP